MTGRSDFKQRVRARQAKTDESYTAARMQVLAARGDQASTSTAARVTGTVLKCGESSLRIHFPGEEASVTLRCDSYDAWNTPPGALVEVRIEKRWTWRGDAYASGKVKRSWVDVPSLGLQPLHLTDHGTEQPQTLADGPDTIEPEFSELYSREVLAPRHAHEFDGVAWGSGLGPDPEDPDACPIIAASELRRSDPDGARRLLMEVLLQDLRCIDAHAHLGNFAFSHPDIALGHYEVALGIGDLSLGDDFTDLLPWGRIFNRPYLRALHGRALCLWRMGRMVEARDAFARCVTLNPTDNQGARFCWLQVTQGSPWQDDAS